MRVQSRQGNYLKAIFIASASQASSTDDEFGQPVGPLLRAYRKSLIGRAGKMEDAGGSGTEKTPTQRGGKENNVNVELPRLSGYAKDRGAIYKIIVACKA